MLHETHLVLSASWLLMASFFGGSAGTASVARDSRCRRKPTTAFLGCFADGSGFLALQSEARCWLPPPQLPLPLPLLPPIEALQEMGSLALAGSAAA